MDIGDPRYIDGLVRFPLNDGRSFEMHPQECWQLTEKIRRYLIDNYAKFDPALVKVIQKNKKRFSVAITKNIGFWESVENGSWEPDTFKIFDYFLSADCHYLDIGSWIGPTALYAAQLAKQAYAFEPDPVAYRELEANLRLNKNAEWASRLAIYNEAIASSNGTIKLGSRAGGGDSMTSTLFLDKDVNWEVEAITLEQFIESNKLQNEKLFIKMDIEGAEYDVIPRLKGVFHKHNVTLFLSMHPHLFVSSLVKSKNNNMLTKISRRLRFVWHHFKLIRSLPFKYFYHADGQRENFYVEILKSFLLGGFPREIVATNKRWDSV